MKKKYKHELTNKANTEHEASEKEGNNSGLGLKLKYVTIRCWDLKRIRHKADVFLCARTTNKTKSTPFSYS